MSERAEVVVVGADVVGLSIARELAVTGGEVLVLEAAQASTRPLGGRGPASQRSTF